AGRLGTEVAGRESVLQHGVQRCGEHAGREADEDGAAVADGVEVPAQLVDHDDSPPTTDRKNDSRLSPSRARRVGHTSAATRARSTCSACSAWWGRRTGPPGMTRGEASGHARSEEHTSELP